MKYREGASSNSFPISILGQLFIASVQNCETIITKIASYRRNIVPQKHLSCICNHYRFVYASLRSLIGPENSHHSFNQSDSKLKTFANFAREWWFLMLSFKAEIGARLARIDPLAHAGCWTAVCRVPHKLLTLLSVGNHFFLTSR